jgi:hypothetical protein
MGTTVRVMGNAGGSYVCCGGYAGSSGGGGATQVGGGNRYVSGHHGVDGGNGGQGYTTSITGTNQVFGSGGGGGSRNGVDGIGGDGAGNAGKPGSSGVANRGGGGGGGAVSEYGGNGGSGIVVVGYDTTDPLSLQGTGGDSIVTTGNYRSHQFTNVGNNTFAVLKAGRCDVLIVAGGGGAINGWTTAGGGGGGGGQVIHLQNYGLGVLTYNIVVGGGGMIAQKGSNSIFNTITATGGGQGNSGSGGSGGGGGRGQIGGLEVTPPANLIPGITLDLRVHFSRLERNRAVRRVRGGQVQGQHGCRQLHGVPRELAVSERQ